jgi:hypothetical protein
MKIFVVDLESVSTRYTGQWKTHIPALLTEQGFDVVVVEGASDIPNATTPGAFLNFGGTNVYKSTQVEKISRMFCTGEVSAGDQFLFTDAWHPGIINIKYMSQLLNIPVVLHGLWHAGSYDSADFLGRIIGDEMWIRSAERSFYHALDHNYFASTFHIEMFVNKLLGESIWAVSIRDAIENKKIVKTGWPFEKLADDIINDIETSEKEDLIVFPHRIAPEKQLDIFQDLAASMSQFQFVVCQEQTLTKKQYHNILGRAKIVFSANLQETLGISMYEATVAGAIPMVPQRLSYSEMYPKEFTYPAAWTYNYDGYLNNKHHIMNKINIYMNEFDHYREAIKNTQKKLEQEYFSAGALLKQLSYTK